MAVQLSTAGIKCAYAIESTAGTKPPSFTNIPGVKSIPDLNPEPSTYDTTDLNATEWKTYIEGLKDIGGALGLKFGISQDFLTLWNETICEVAETALAAGKACWLEFYHPKLTDGFFFTCEPCKAGFSSADVDQAWDATVNVVPTGNIGWATAVVPTDATE